VTTLDIATSYVRAGVSVLPIALDGSKRPDPPLLPRELNKDGDRFEPTWKPFQERLPTAEELRRWYGTRPRGIGTVCGAVSGNLEVIDFDIDAGEIFGTWSELVEAEKPGLIARLNVIETPRPGFQVRYRVPDLDPMPGNCKLAVDPARPANERTLIETRAEGGYALAPGSPAECHSTGRLYQHVSGPPLTELPCLTIEEREILIRCAASFSREVVDDQPKKQLKTAGLSPGDDYNRRGPEWATILEPHGWTRVKGDYWRRPDKKDPGWSATTGRCKAKSGHELFAVFSSNADPFPGPSGGKVCSVHSKFGVYALLNHGGDFGAAAKALAAQGYGEQHSSNGTTHNGAANGKQHHQSPRIITADELLRLTLPEPRWAIPSLVPEGLDLFAGKPKLGKSWLALNLAIACAMGGTALGKIVVEGGDVLYLALEDTPRRLQDRLRKILARQGGKQPRRLHLATEWARQDKGGLDELRRWVDGHKHARLIVVDTWVKYRPARTRNADAYEEDYSHAAAIKKLADEAHIAILPLHHCRKMGAPDPLEEVSGTLGLTGAADAILVLRRERGQHDAALHVTGRDVEEQELALRWHKEDCLWSILGDAEEYRISKERKTILDVFRRSPGQTQSVQQVAAILEKKVGTVRKLLWQMAEAGQLQALTAGHYMLTSGNAGNAGNGAHAGNGGNGVVDPSVTGVTGGGEETGNAPDVLQLPWEQGLE
jgi:hypothetical protein